MERLATLAFIVFCLVGAVVGVFILWSSATGAGGVLATAGARPPSQPVRTPRPGGPPPLPAAPIDIAGATTLGSRQAKLALVTYTEFKCPYCGLFARDTWPALKRQYVDSGLVRMVFRHLPLDKLHPIARPAAEVAVCAEQQSKFWPLFDRLFANQAELDAAELTQHVKSLGLDMKRFTACLTTEAAARVQADEASGRALGVSATPTFLIGLVQADGRVLIRERINGTKPVAVFEQALDRWLSETGIAAR